MDTYRGYKTTLRNAIAHLTVLACKAADRLDWDAARDYLNAIDIIDRRIKNGIK